MSSSSSSSSTSSWGRQYSSRSSHRNRNRGGFLPWSTGGLPSILMVLAILCSILNVSVLASEGDRSPEYKNCVKSCVADVCGPLRPQFMSSDGDGTVKPLRLPLILRATFWSCPDDCAYHCTHRVTNDAYRRVKEIKQKAKHNVWAQVEADVKNGGRGASRKEINERIAEQIKNALDGLTRVQKQMVQFHGKWVFIRVLGMQEPLSVIFSVMNLAVHVHYLGKLRKMVPDVFPLKMVYLAHGLISANAWVWSAIFHARDKPFTERMDYFSAGAAILSGFFFTISRLYRLAPGEVRFMWLLRISGGALLLHILYLSFSSRFDYAYNMTVNVILALGHNVLWLAYSLLPGLFPDGSTDRHRMNKAALRAHKPASGFSTPNGGSPPAPVSTKIPLPSTSKKARRRLQLILLLLTLASSLELLDFAALFRAVDAHCLWHLSTVPISIMWYDWIIEDSQECVNLIFWIGEPSYYYDHLSSNPLFKKLHHLNNWARQTAGPISARIQRRSRESGVELTHLTESLSNLANKAGLSTRFNHQNDESSMTSSSGIEISAANADEHHRSISTAAGKEREKTSDEITQKLHV
ncbi:unnamed protein product [Sympodiomycopsis kandeliae]